MKKFKVCGPYKVALKTVTNSYWRLSSAQRELWDATRKDVDGGCCKKKGCYIYTNSNNSPIYVGKTDNSFGQECFKEHKQYLLNEYLKQKKLCKCCLNIYFLYFTGKNETDAYWEIDSLETFLIKKAHKANKKGLLNTKKKKMQYEIIDGEHKLNSKIFCENRRTRKASKKRKKSKIK